jgi:arsenate reductase
MIEIYHNPRCSKSREALSALESQTSDFEVILYLEERLSVSKLKKVIQLLKLKPIDVIRKNESIWKEHYKGLEFTDAELIKLMIKHPKLIERPIIINGNQAVIGRPASKLLEIL